MPLELLGRFVFRFLENALSLFQLAVFLIVILSWFSIQKNKFTEFLATITGPALIFARRVTPQIGNLDFSPIIVFFSIDLIRLGLSKIAATIF